MLVSCLLSFQEAKKLLIQVVAEMKKGVCNTCLQIIKRLKIVFLYRNDVRS
jgi:hypothetical protein